MTSVQKEKVVPIKSKKQYGLMQAIAHGSGDSLRGSSKDGPSKDVAKEFIDKTPSSKRKKFARAISKGK